MRSLASFSGKYANPFQITKVKQRQLGWVTMQNRTLTMPAIPSPTQAE